MAIANTINSRTVFGDRVIVFGKSVISGGTDTGEVATGLAKIELFIPVGKSSAFDEGVVVEEDFPLAKGTVTVFAGYNDYTFYWMAIGSPA